MARPKRFFRRTKNVPTELAPMQQMKGKVSEPAITRRGFLRVIRNRFVRTAIETPFVEIGGLFSHKLANMGTMTKEERAQLRNIDMSRRTDRKWLLASLVGAPLWEEIGFRVLPSHLTDRWAPALKGKKAWKVGVPVAAVFAMAHIGTVPEKFRGKFIPLNQFILGCYYWKVLRERGKLPTIMAHSESNALIPLLEKVFFKW